MNFVIKNTYQVVVWKGIPQETTHRPRLKKLNIQIALDQI